MDFVETPAAIGLRGFGEEADATVRFRNYSEVQRLQTVALQVQAFFEQGIIVVEHREGTVFFARPALASLYASAAVLYSQLGTVRFERCLLAAEGRE